MRSRRRSGTAVQRCGSHRLGLQQFAFGALARHEYALRILHGDRTQQGIFVILFIFLRSLQFYGNTWRFN
jgi:hypothetical protein